MRSTEWDGPAPAVGDVLDDGTLWRVVSVAAGPGLGQWRLDLEPLGRLITWRTVTVFDNGSPDARPERTHHRRHSAPHTRRS